MEATAGSPARIAPFQRCPCKPALQDLPPHHESRFSESMHSEEIMGTTAPGGKGVFLLTGRCGREGRSMNRPLRPTFKPGSNSPGAAEARTAAARTAILPPCQRSSAEQRARPSSERCTSRCRVRSEPRSTGQ
eukprot:353244-Chlamydomonas_euryale.AAC.3